MVARPAGEAAFVDTSAWYALFVATDPRHAQATAIYQRLRSAMTTLWTTDWVAVETAALLHRRVSKDQAQRAAAAILGTPQVKIQWIDRDAAVRALERYRAAASGVSLVDCGSFVAMDQAGIGRAFAFDADFGAQGFSLER